MAAFDIHNLSFTYPGQELPALSDINIKIKQGEYITLCGKSGSGKTTLLKQLKPSLTPAGEKSGDILLDGLPISGYDARTLAKTVGYVMQNTDDQIVTDKVWHELAFGLENTGESQRTIRLRVAEMASYFGIQNWFHKDTGTLSGGQKQLLNLASVMAMQPQVLILDEPTSQLDPIAASDFLNTVRKINLELGTTVIITEHRLEDIFPHSDRVIVMEEGKIICDDTPAGVSAALHVMDDGMFAAMPSPVRIYYGLSSSIKSEVQSSEQKPNPDTESNDAPENAPSSLPCPLTVRDGRNWLERIIPEHSVDAEAIQNQNKEGFKQRGLLKSSAASDTYNYNADNKIKRSAKAAVSLNNIWFRYDKDGDDILKGLSFDVPEGQIFAIVGGNGTGKTTMLRCMCRALKPYRGRVSIHGKNIEKYKASELFSNGVAMLPQDPQSIFAKTSVREDLEEMLGSKRAAALEKRLDIEGFDAVPLDPEVAEAATLCQITHLLKRNPYDLSGGEMQRAALAKVLMTNPQILLLDEPTKGMDSSFKEHFAQILKDLTARNLTVIMVSHDVEFCAMYADTIGMLFDGELISSGNPKNFFRNNSFYTTAANRMARHIFPDAVTVEDIVEKIRANQAHIQTY